MIARSRYTYRRGCGMMNTACASWTLTSGSPAKPSSPLTTGISRPWTKRSNSSALSQTLTMCSPSGVNQARWHTPPGGTSRSQPTRSRASSYRAAVMPRQVRRMTAAMLRLRPGRLPSSWQAGEAKGSRRPVPLPGPPGTARMPDTRPADLGLEIAEIEGAVARAELQLLLPCSAIAMREGAGRDRAGSAWLVRDTGPRVAGLHTGRGRLLAERDRQGQGSVGADERPG